MKRIRKIFKKATASAVAVAMALASFNVSYTADTAYADSTGTATGTVSPSSFLSSEDMANYSGEPLSQKVSITGGSSGNTKNTWYIAGSDTDGSLVLISTDLLDSGMYTDDVSSPAKYSSSVLKTSVDSLYTALATNTTNLDSSKTAYAYLAQKVTLSDATDAGELYFYPAAYDTNDGTVRLGASNSIKLTTEQLFSKFEGTFWLRTVSSSEQSKAYTVSSEDRNIAAVDVKTSNSVVPVFNVDTSKVLFASSAPTVTHDASLDSSTLYLRLDADKVENAGINTVAEADSSGITFYSRDTAEYLYIQWNDGTSDHVKSYSMQYVGNYLSASDIGLNALTSDCKIWIESYMSGTIPMPAYAKYVEVRDSSHDADPHYLDASSLKSITNCANEYKAYFGKYSDSNVTWYIAGNDPDDADSLVLVSATTLGTSVYRNSGSNTGYAGSQLEITMNETLYNKIFTSGEKENVKGITLSVDPGSTTSFLYPISLGDSNINTAGVKNGVLLSSIWSKLKGGNSEFWGRRPETNSDRNSFATSKEVTSAGSIVNAVLPVCHLYLPNILFASSAAVATADATTDAKAVLTFRFDSAKGSEGATVEDRISGSAEYTSSKIMVTGAKSGEYLYVEWNDGTTEKLKSFALSVGDSEYTASDIGVSSITSDFKIWIETQQDSVAYAKNATAHVHTEVEDAAVPATCTASGLTAGSHCSVCGETVTAQTETEALGHDFTGTWTVTKEATATEAGEKETECLNGCGEKKTETIPALGEAGNDGDDNTVNDGNGANDTSVDNTVNGGSGAGAGDNVGGSGDNVTDSTVSDDDDDYDTSDDTTGSSSGSATATGTQVLNTTSDNVVSAGAPVEDVALENSTEELLGSDIFTAAEKRAIANGSSAKVYVGIDSLPAANVPQADRNAIENEATSVLGINFTISYMDMSLFKQIGSAASQKVSEPGVGIKVTVELPENMINRNVGVSRRYVVIRIHNGEVTTIQPTFDAATNKLAFSTDRFSTYAIAYTDEAAVSLTSSGSPKTADTANIPAMAALMIFAGMILLGVKNRHMRREN